MNDLDLNIENYQTKDLERFFRLENSYTEDDISRREYEIRELLLSSGHIDSRFKRDLIIFLGEGRKRLVSEKIKIPKPTTIPVNEINKRENYPFTKIDHHTREENILEKRKTEFSYQLTSDFFPGTLNPLDTRILKKYLTIDTRFLSHLVLKSDFTVSLPSKIQKVVSMECESFEMLPSNLYNISTALENNYIYVSISTKECEYNNIFIIPDGYYNDEEILSFLTTLCQEQKKTPFAYLKWEKDPSTSGKCVVTIDLEEDDFYLQRINSVSLDFTVNIHGEPNIVKDNFKCLGYLLGFTKKHYFEKLSYIGEIQINLNASLPYIYLSVDDYQNRSIATFQPAFSQISMSPSILARIKLNNNTNKIELLSSTRRYFGPIDVTRLQFRLLDCFGRNIESKSNYSLCLSFQIIYDL